MSSAAASVRISFSNPSQFERTKAEYPGLTGLRRLFVDQVFHAMINMAVQKMISRKSAILIAEAYHEKFASTYQGGTKYEPRTKYILLYNELYDFFYTEGYEAWFLNAAKLVDHYKDRALREFVMKIHTGETMFAATINWTWEARETLGQRYLKDLAEDILASPNRVKVSYKRPEPSPSIKPMQSQLELDGYIFRDGLLLQIEDSTIDEQSEQGYLAALVASLKIPDPDTIHHHLELAEEHYRQGKWDDSIGNSRKFLEAILAGCAKRYSKEKHAHDIPNKTLESPREVRDILEREGLLETKEKEALAKIYGLLSHTGGHPHIAEKDQARLLWHMALTFSQFALLRVEGTLKAP